VLTVREREPGDVAAVTALMAAAADRVAALDPRVRPARAPGEGPGLVAVDPAGAVRGHVRPVPQELAADDAARSYSPDRSVGWADTAADGPAAVLAMAGAIRAAGPGAEADGLLWPAADEPTATWWSAAGLTPAGGYALRPPGPLPGPLPAGVTARPARPDEEAAVLALHREAVEFQAAASPYVRVLPSGPIGFADRLRSGRSTSTVLAAGDRLLGVCEWWRLDGEGPPVPPGRYAYLNSVAVTGAARGRGLGRALVSAALAAAGPDLDGSTLWFSPANPIASRVWPHLGWRPLWTAWERRTG
jgi:GNAT superfamily N-acetyltransferase